MSANSETSISGNKWLKKVPDLTPERQAIRDDFMRAHLEAMQTKWYGVIERFNHKYPLRSAFPGARTLEIGAGLGDHLKWEGYDRQEYHLNELAPNSVSAFDPPFPGSGPRPETARNACRMTMNISTGFWPSMFWSLFRTCPRP